MTFFLITRIFESFFKAAGGSTGAVHSGGILTSGEFVESDYFRRLLKLGDFNVATNTKFHTRLPYEGPYLDFGITEIYQKFYFVIGIIFSLTNSYKSLFNNVVI